MVIHGLEIGYERGGEGVCVRIGVGVVEGSMWGQYTYSIGGKF